MRSSSMSARQEAPDVVGDLATRVEDLPNVVVHDQVQIPAGKRGQAMGGKRLK